MVIIMIIMIMIMTMRINDTTEWRERVLMRWSGEGRYCTWSMRESTDTLSALTLHPGRFSSASTPDKNNTKERGTEMKSK